MMSLTTKTKIPKIISFFALMVFGIQLSFSITPSISINEINYRSINEGENIDFIELHNSSANPVNLSGWTLTDGIGFKFPAGSSISAGGFVVIAANPSDCQTAFGVSNTYGPYTGSLSSDGDEIKLRDANYTVVDEVDYLPWQEWPSVRYLNGGLSPASIQKLHPNLASKYAGSWASASPTPKAANNNVLATNMNSIPVIESVSKKPDAPLSNQAVTIKTKVTNSNLLNSSLSVNLQYQVVDAGSYINKSEAAYGSSWSTISMYDNGLGIDSLSNDGTYTALIPSNIQVHRRLVRYRIQVSTSGGYQKIYPDQNHRESNYAYFVYNGQSSFNGISLNQLSYLQEVHLLAKASAVNDYVDGTGYSGTDYPGEGTLVYRGKVYDHIGFRARGKDSRHFRLKKNLKFDLNNEHPIKVYNDYDKSYDVKRGKLSLSGSWVADGNAHGLAESLIYKIADLTGSINKSTDYCQFRIIDGSSEGGDTGDFRGIYLITEDFNADLIEEHGLPDGNIYSYKPFALSHQGDEGPFGTNNSIYTNWNTAMGNSQDGCTSCAVPTQSQSFYENNLALDLFYNDWVMNEICGNSETNYPGQHSYIEYYNPITQKWLIRGADYDNMFGMPEDEKVVYNKNQSKDYRKVRVPLKDQLLNYTDFKKEIANRLRSTLDLLFNAEQLDHLLTSESSKIFNPNNTTNWTDADKSRWEGKLDGHGYQINYNNYQNDVIEWYRNWFNNRKNHLLNESTSYEDWDVDQYLYENPITNIYEEEDNRVPAQPSITYNGPGGYPLDQLLFTNSSFSDNTGNFAALEWRIGEWSDPSNPAYNPLNKPKYEIETKWSSGEIYAFQNSITIPADAQLKVGRTYKIRVRYKDSTNRWSHWSEAITFKPSPALNTPNYNLVINEIMYHPSNNCGVEFLELFNSGNSAISLDNFKFVEGIDFDFPTGSSLAAGDYLVLTNDSLEFIYKYGFSPFGDYKGGLSNSTDTLILTGPFRTVVDMLTYTDDTPWVSEPDGTGTSLSLIEAGLDNALAANWHYSFDVCGTPGAHNNLCLPITNNPSIANLTCYQSADGFIANAVSGGTAPYSYVWNTGQSSSVISNLQAGNYSVTITDALLCEITENFLLVQPIQLVLNVNSTDETSYQSADGTVSVTVTGGTPPYTYSWSNGAAGSSQNGLSAGIYNVVVTDYNNCTASATATVDGIICNSLQVGVTQKDVDCYGNNNGNLYINSIQNGNAPYNILWSTGATGTAANNLSPGTYIVDITDNSGCTHQENYTISGPNAALSASTIITGSSSNSSYDGAIDLTVQGGSPPFTYYWSNGSTIEDPANLLAGLYWVSITDSNGCNKVVTSIQVEVETCQIVISLLDNSILPSGIKNASDYIESNCIINANSNISFKAGNLINLQNDFEVRQGATFEALIEDCN